MTPETDEKKQMNYFAVLLCLLGDVVLSSALLPSFTTIHIVVLSALQVQAETQTELYFYSVWLYGNTFTFLFGFLVAHLAKQRKLHHGLALGICSAVVYFVWIGIDGSPVFSAYTLLSGVSAVLAAVLGSYVCLKIQAKG